MEALCTTGQPFIEQPELAIITPLIFLTASSIKVVRYLVLEQAVSLPSIYYHNFVADNDDKRIDVIIVNM